MSFTYRIRERMFQGAKVSPMVLSLLGVGTKVPVTTARRGWGPRGLASISSTP